MAGGGSQVNDFCTEANWDTLVVNGNNKSGSSGLVGVMADGQISWLFRYCWPRQCLAHLRCDIDGYASEPTFAIENAVHLRNSMATILGIDGSR